MTLEECQAYAEEIQKKLRLRDWNVTVFFLSKKQAKSIHGNCEWVVFDKSAKLGLRKKEKSDSITKWTIRHELCHLLLEGHKPCPDGNSDEQYEFGLDLLAKLIE